MKTRLPRKVKKEAIKHYKIILISLGYGGRGLPPSIKNIANRNTHKFLGVMKKGYANRGLHAAIRNYQKRRKLIK